MGLLSMIGKGLGLAGAVAAAPFTGGGTLAALGPILGAGGGLLSAIGSAAGPTASSIAGGMTSGLNQENLNKQKAFEDSLAASKANESNLENRLQLQEGFQNNAYHNAMRSALAKNIQDVSISGGNPRVPVVNFSGGLRPSAFGPEGRTAATTLNNQAQAQLLNGDQLPALPSTLPAPTFNNPGLGTNILGAAGAFGTAMNAANAANQQNAFQKSLLQKIQDITDMNKQNQQAAAITASGAGQDVDANGNDQGGF
jgi:hypothetical protein